MGIDGLLGPHDEASQFSVVDVMEGRDLAVTHRNSYKLFGSGVQDNPHKKKLHHDDDESTQQK
jgi:hypothetical protein